MSFIILSNLLSNTSHFPYLCVVYCVIMSQTRGACGHLKAAFDKHVTCMSFYGCTYDTQCGVCSLWSPDIWDITRARRTAKSRRKTSSIYSSSSDFSGFSLQSSGEATVQTITKKTKDSEAVFEVHGRHSPSGEPIPSSRGSFLAD